MDLALNALIAGVMLALVIHFSRAEGHWSPSRLIPAFRFFTVQSNVLCAFAALLMCFFPQCSWVWMLKYVGTAAVTVTMLTVLLFLGPMAGFKRVMHGSDFIMHLVTPLLALVSFCVYERRGLRFWPAMAGMLPVVLYGVLYGWKILLAKPPRRWDDFYGFNRTGKWYLSMAGMLAGCFLICMGLMALQNL